MSEMFTNLRPLFNVCYAVSVPYHSLHNTTPHSLHFFTTQTTLAMSVMWGLTGNMDPRLVSDGKALDVAFDAGQGKPKRTAEVTLTGACLSVCECVSVCVYKRESVCVI
jgi:hypothetical protein